MRLVHLVRSLVLIGILLAGCNSGRDETPTPTSRPVTASPTPDPAASLEPLLVLLRSAGATVAIGGPQPQSLFPAQAWDLIVDGTAVRAYEFVTAESRQSFLSDLSPDGYELTVRDAQGAIVGATIIDWVAPPTFWALDRFLLQYVGQDPALVERLTSAFGPSVAGGLVRGDDDLWLRWDVTGGIAGFCDTLLVHAGGRADLLSCADETTPLASTTLSRDQLNALTQWHESLRPFTAVDDTGPVADQMVQSLSFYGLGSEPAGMATEAAIIAFAADLMAQLRTQAGDSPPEPPPTSTPLDAFLATWRQALLAEDLDALAPLLAEPFAFAPWRSEAQFLDRVEARQLIGDLFPEADPIVFDEGSTDLTALLDGQDPFQMLGPDRTIVAVYLTREWSVGRDGHAVLLITEDMPGQFQWAGMLYALDGFPPPGDPVPQRIEFAPGAISATVDGQVTPPFGDIYHFRALAGQVITITVTSPGQVANFSLTGLLDGQPLKRLVNEDRTWSGTLPTTQDYELRVNTAGVASSYSLTLTIAPLNRP